MHHPDAHSHSHHRCSPCHHCAPCGTVAATQLLASVFAFLNASFPHHHQQQLFAACSPFMVSVSSCLPVPASHLPSSRSRLPLSRSHLC
eukprot:175052-Rhodomonas_salina.1